MVKNYQGIARVSVQVTICQGSQDGVTLYLTTAAKSTKCSCAFLRLARKTLLFMNKSTVHLCMCALQGKHIVIHAAPLADCGLVSNNSPGAIDPSTPQIRLGGRHQAGARLRAPAGTCVNLFREHLRGFRGQNRNLGVAQDGHGSKLNHRGPQF